VIEVGREYPEYVFVLDSWVRVEVLKLAPGQPCRLSHDEWGKSAHAFLHAVPVEKYDERLLAEWPRGEMEKYRVWWRISFTEGVWFYDSRNRAVSTYRLETRSGHLNLEIAHRTPESTGGKATRYVIGLLLSAAAILSVRRVWRRRATPASA
jgi:hypothetical protein